MMAIFSTHTLNSVDGTHAGEVGLQLIQIWGSGARYSLIDAATDKGGRFKQTLILEPRAIQATYELVLQSGAYFQALGGVHAGQILSEIVLRFHMPDAERLYHIPFMLAPNSYSVWWSGES